MQIPKRKGEEDRRLLKKADDYLTADKIQRLQDELVSLKKQIPAAAAEVQRTAEMGDLSENAGYQIAKSTLRKMHSRILSIEDRIRQAIPIDETASTDGVIRMGSTVVLGTGDTEVTYQIVGGQETDPLRGRISHTSPLGSALLDHVSNDKITIKAGDREIDYLVKHVG